MYYIIHYIRCTYYKIFLQLFKFYFFSDSSKEDNDDSLDIKPPQAALKSDAVSRHEEKKKSRHSRKHECK